MNRVHTVIGVAHLFIRQELTVGLLCASHWDNHRGGTVKTRLLPSRSSEHMRQKQKQKTKQIKKAISYISKVFFFFFLKNKIV